MPHDISVAICTLNGAGKLPEVIKALKSELPSKAEILVIDDGSKDNSSEIATKMSVRVIRHPENLGYGAARQTAVDACRTEILAYVDDSCVVTQGWYRGLQNAWSSADSETRIIVGLMRPSQEPGYFGGYTSRYNPFVPIQVNSVKTPLARVFSYLGGRAAPIDGSPIFSAPNGNMSGRIKSIRDVGGFDSQASGGSEDDLLCSKIREKFGAGAIRFAEQCEVVHYETPTLKRVLRRSYSYGKSNSILAKKRKIAPIFFPGPSLLCFVTLWSFYLLGSGIGLMTIPLWVYLLFFRFSIISKKGNRRHIVLDPLITLAAEICQNVGFLVGIIKKNQYVA